MLSDYVALIREFIDGRITAAEFERSFLDRYRSDDEIRPEDEFRALERLFGAVDAYMGELPVEDPETDLDEAGLRKYAEDALASLTEIVNRTRRN